MLQALDCPVCPRRQIPFNEESCPGCGADLRPLVCLAELPLAVFNRALECHARGDLAGSITAAACALAIKPDFVAASLLLGKLLWKNGDRNLALIHWRSAAEQDPGNAEVERLLSVAGQYAD